MNGLAHAHTVADFNGHELTLMYSAEAEGIWEVYDDKARYLGTIVETHSGADDGYKARSHRNKGQLTNDEITDWRSAVQYLIETV